MNIYDCPYFGSTLPEDFELFFDPILVHLKYDALATEKDLTELNNAFNDVEKPSEENEIPTDKLVGLVDIEPSESKKSVEKWAKDLARSIPASTLSFGKVLEERLVVQSFLRQALSSRQKTKKNPSTTTEMNIPVPVVVRLSILTMFPLIEALSKLKDFDYFQLCSETLKIITEVINSIPPLSLRREPSDCLDAFTTFILKLVTKFEYKMETQEARTSLVALLGLAISRGGGKNLFQLTDCLFKTLSTSKDVQFEFGSFLEKLNQHQKMSVVPLPYCSSELASWNLSVIPGGGKSTVRSMATDGEYIYLYHAGQGIMKIGTGANNKNTVRGHTYLAVVPAPTTANFGSLTIAKGQLFVVLEGAKPNQIILSVYGLNDLCKRGQTILKTQAQRIEDCHLISDGHTLFLLINPKGTPTRVKGGPPAHFGADYTTSHSDSFSDSESRSNDVHDYSVEDDQFVDLSFEPGEEKPSPSTNVADPFVIELYDASTDSEHLSPKKSLKLVGPSDFLPSKTSTPLNEPKQVSPAASLNSLFLAPSGAPGSGLGQGLSFPLSFAVPPGLVQIPGSYDLGGARRLEMVLGDGFGGISGLNLGLPSETSEPNLIRGMDFERGQFYTNGYHLVCLLPSSQEPEELSRAIIFSLENGTLLEELALDVSLSVGSLVTYCSNNDQIWSYSPGQSNIRTWCNSGARSCDADAIEIEGLGLKHQTILDKFSNETGASAQCFGSLDTLLFLFASSERLAKQHSMYDQARIGSSLVLSNGPNYFCVDDDPRIYFFLLQNIQHAVQFITKKIFLEEMSFILLISIRLIRLNFSYHFSKTSDVPSLFPNAGLEDGLNVFNEIRVFLLKCIFDPSQLSQPTLATITQEAVNTLGTGFTIFYRQPLQQVEQLVELLKAPQPVAQTLVTHLFRELSVYPFISDLLCETVSPGHEPMDVEESSRVSRDDLKKETRKKTKKKAKEVPTNTLAMSFLELVVDCLLKEASQKDLNHPQTSPATKFLLALQRDILAKRFGIKFLVRYSMMVFHKCTSFVQSLQRAGDLEHCQDTLIGVVLWTLVTNLCRKDLISRTEVASLVSSVVSLVSAFDQLHRQLEPVVEANKKYLSRGVTSKGKRAILESQHPYPSGKNQMKKTINIPGAAALSIYFDPRCSTAHPGDTLQINGADHQDGNIFSSNSFPSSPLIIQGDTASFTFTSASQSRMDSGQSRWGFKCLVTKALSIESFEPTITSWSLDLEASLAWFASKCASHLLSEPYQDNEKKFAVWLDTGLFSGGLKEFSSETGSHTWLYAFVAQGDDQTKSFWAWLRQVSPGRPKFLPVTSLQPTERCERCYVACVLHHLGLVQEAIDFAAALVKRAELPNQSITKFTVVGQKAWLLGSWLLRRGQLEKSWQTAIFDTVEQKNPQHDSPLDEYLKSLSADLVPEISEMKEVDSSGPIEQVLASLRTKLQEEVEKTLKEPPGQIPNAYQTVSQLVMDKLEFLLLQVVPVLSGSSNVALWDHREPQPMPHSYQPWKDWTCVDSLDNTLINPLQSILSFGRSILNFKELERALKVQHQRARGRLAALQSFKDLLKVSSFPVILHQVLGSISFSSHYLNGVAGGGPLLCTEISVAFAQVFELLVGLFRQSHIDSDSKKLALRACGLLFQEDDAPILAKSNIFGALQSLISDDTPSEPPLSLSTSALLHVQLQHENKPEDSEEDSDSEEEDRPKAPTTEPAPITQPTHLTKTPASLTTRSVAWVVFRLLASLCMKWRDRESQQVAILQKQVFEIVCAEIVRHSNMLSNKKEDQDQCYELLELLFSLGGTSILIRSLAGTDNVLSLISLLTMKMAPKSQRLVFRLCRKLLPVLQDPALIDRLVSILFTHISNLVLLSPSQETQPQSVDTEMGEATPGSKTSSEIEHAVILYKWDTGDKKLAETCHSTLGANFAENRSAAELKAKSMLSSLSPSTPVTLTTGPAKQCNRLAQAIAPLGGTVTVDLLSKDEKKVTANLKPNEPLSKIWPMFWVDGDTKDALVSEYIALFRLLLASENSPWGRAIVDQLGAHLKLIPAIFQQLSLSTLPEEVSRVLASLSILGSWNETIRIGAQVQVRLPFGESKKALVIADHNSRPQVIFDPSSRVLTSHRKTALSAFSEFKVPTPLLEKLSESMLPSLLAALRAPAAPQDFQAKFLFSYLKNCCLAVLNEFCSLPSTVSVLVNQYSTDLITLKEMAESCHPQAKDQDVTSNFLQAKQKFWNFKTSPVPLNPPQHLSPMIRILPFFANSYKADLFPTCFECIQSGLIFWGSDKRTVECGTISSPTQNSSSRRSFGSYSSSRRPTDILVCGNAPIPVHIEHYFEVTVLEGTSTAHISVGLCTEGALQWEFGSYRYQANKTKTWYPSNNKDAKHVAYGLAYKKDDVIGCGWKPETNTIYFTKNKVALPAAWQISPPTVKMVPAIGISKGVKVKINFGQEPFEYNLVTADQAGPADSVAQQQQKEARERQLAEQDEEEKRKAKEKKERRERDAQEMVDLGLGFTLQQVLKAMDATRYDGNKDLLCAWILDNPQISEPDPPPKKEEPKQEPSKVGEQVKPSEKPIMSHPEKCLSQNYHLSSTCQFRANSSHKYGESNLETELAPIINDMRSIMVRDSRQPYEIENAVFQFREHVVSGNLSEANRLFEHLCGPASHSLVLFTQKKSLPTLLKIDEVECGMPLQVTYCPPENGQVWIPEMDGVMEKVGVVKKIDHQNQLVLLNFYDNEYAALQEWWFPLCTLSKKPRETRRESVSEPLLDLENRLSNLIRDLQNLTARQILLSFPEHKAFSLDSKSTLYFGDTLKLAINAHLFRPGFVGSVGLLTRNTQCSPIMNFKNQLQQFFTSLGQPEKLNFARSLCTECCSALTVAQKLHSSASVFDVDRALTANDHEIQIPEGTIAVINFDRSTNLAKAKIVFSKDKEGKEVLLSVDQDSLPFPSFITHNTFYHKIVGSDSNKYKFAVVPVSQAVLVARLGIEFLTDVCVPFLDASHISSLFTCALQYLTDCPVPTVIKESFLVLLSHVTFQLKSKLSLSDLPLGNMKILTEEMNALYSAESQTENLRSAYLQNLIALMVLLTDEVKPPLPNEQDEEDRLLLMVAIQLVNGIDMIETKKWQNSTITTVSTAGVIKDKLDDQMALSGGISRDQDSDGDHHVDDDHPIDGEQSLSSMDSDQDIHGDDDVLFDVEDESDDALKEALRMSLDTTHTITSMAPPPAVDPPQPLQPIPIQQQSSPSRPVVPPHQPTVDLVLPVADASPFWFRDIVCLSQYLCFFETICSPITSPSIHSVIGSAWDHLRHRSLEVESLFLIDHLPVVPVDCRDTFISSLYQHFNSCCAIVPGSLYLSMDDNHTLPWCILQLYCIDDANTFIKKVPQLSLRPQSAPPSSSQPQATSVPIMEVIHLNLRKETDSSKPKEQLKQYIMAKMVESNTPGQVPNSVSTSSLTPRCRQLLTDVFIRYSGSTSSVLGLPEFDRLQVACCGTEFGLNNYEVIVKDYPDYITSAPISASDPNAMDVDGEEKRGLNLEGFLLIYHKQCIQYPLETLDEFVRLGYDRNLQFHCEPNQPQAIQAILGKNRDKWSLAFYHDLCSYIDQLFSSTPLHSSTSIPSTLLHHFHPSSPEAILYPHLADIPSSTLRLHYQILLNLNTLLPKVLPLINLSKETVFCSRLLCLRGVIFHDIKMQFFFSVLDKTSVPSSVVPQPKLVINRLKLAEKNDKHPSEWQKSTCLGIAFGQLRNTNPQAFRQKKPHDTSPHFSIKVDFEGENVQGDGGPYRQFFTDVSKELHNQLIPIPLLTPCPNGVSNIGNNQDKYVLIPNANERIHLKLLTFLGQLMGMAIRTGVLLTLDFSNFTWKPLIGVPPDLSDLKSIDTNFVQLIGSLDDPDTLSSVQGLSSIALSDKTTKVISVDGTPLALGPNNRDTWIQAATNIRLQEAEIQIKAIRKGLSDVIPLALLNLCTPQDLEWRVQGKPTIDIQLLKRHTEYSNVSSTAPHILYFWEVLESFNQQERRAFIQFVWAQERLPANDQEFIRTSTRMLIKPFMGTTEPDNTFPKADTCFFNLTLPEYSSAEILRTKLLMAISTDSDSMNADAVPQND